MKEFLCGLSGTASSSPSSQRGKPQQLGWAKCEHIGIWGDSLVS